MKKVFLYLEFPIAQISYLKTNLDIVWGLVMPKIWLYALLWELTCTIVYFLPELHVLGELSQEMAQ
jgi:hypothetical protein